MKRTEPSRQVHMSRERGAVQVGNELVRYEILVMDARTAEQRAEGQVPDGNVIVIVPGHAQTVLGPRRLVRELAVLCRSNVAWCIDPTPARGGDCTEARAIVEIVRHRLSHLSTRPLPQATIAGWSHGGGEALRAAQEAPELFPQYLGFCSVGLVERNPLEMLSSFVGEAVRVVGADLVRSRWADLGETVRVGVDGARGLVLDLVRSRSPRAVLNDILWACRKVPGLDFDYPGEVCFLLGTSDTVIRWRDPFPGCSGPEQLAAFVPLFQRECFPHSQRVEVRLIDGNHVTPETDPARFVHPGLSTLGQLG